MPFITIQETHFQAIKYQALAKVKNKKDPTKLESAIETSLGRTILTYYWYLFFLLKWGLIMLPRLTANSRV